MRLVDSIIYLLAPTDESYERVLHPGRVVRAGDDSIVAEFVKVTLPAPGSVANLFFDGAGKFLQQNAVVVAAPDIEPNRGRAAFKLVGDAMLANERAVYRVSTVFANIVASVDGEIGCDVLDISPDGLATVTRRAHALGTAIRVMIEYEGHHLEGRAAVQTIKPLGNSRFRCGLTAPTTDSRMRSTLEKMTAHAQRAQLRRTRRTA